MANILQEFTERVYNESWCHQPFMAPTDKPLMKYF